MTRKLIQTTTSGANTVKVYIDYSWEEYQVTLVGQPEATYHTNDRLDALDTAKAMLSRANLQNWEPSHAHS